MFIKAQKKWRKSADGLVMVPYTYYRLCESFRDESGHVRQRMIFGLGELAVLQNESERKELARLLDGMIGSGQYLMSERPDIYELALFFYSLYKERREADRFRKIEEERLKELEKYERDYASQHWRRTYLFRYAAQAGHRPLLVVIGLEPPTV